MEMIIDKESVPMVKEVMDFLIAKMDWIQIKNEYQFTAYLPGMEMKDVTIVIVEDMVLKISRELKIDEGDTALKKVFGVGVGDQISRSFRFPKAVELNELKTGMTGGVLTVTLKRKNKGISKLQALMAKFLPACVFIGGNLIHEITDDDQ